MLIYAGLIILLIPPLALFTVAFTVCLNEAIKQSKRVADNEKR